MTPGPASAGHGSGSPGGGSQGLGGHLVRGRGGLDTTAEVIGADTGHDGVTLHRHRGALGLGLHRFLYAAQQDGGGEALSDH